MNRRGPATRPPPAPGPGVPGGIYESLARVLEVLDRKANAIRAWNRVARRVPGEVS